MPTRRWSSPQKPLAGQAFINRSHPLARGLTYYWLLHDNAGPPTELVSRTDWGAVRTSGTTWTANAQGGVGLTFAASSDSVDLNPTPHGNGDITLIGRGLFLDHASPRALCRISGGAAGGVDVYRFRNQNVTVGWTLELFGVVNLFSFVVPTAGNFVSAGCAYTRGVGGRFHQRDLTALTTTAATVLDSNTPYSGPAGVAQIGEEGNFQSWQSYLESVAVWSRALSDEEMAWYHEEPLTMLQPSRVRVGYRAAAAAPAGGKPWTYQRMMVA